MSKYLRKASAIVHYTDRNNDFDNRRTIRDFTISTDNGKFMYHFSIGPYSEATPFDAAKDIIIKARNEGFYIPLDIENGVLVPRILFVGFGHDWESRKYNVNQTEW